MSIFDYLNPNRGLLIRIIHNQEKIMSDLSDLQAKVSAEDSVIASAITLLNGLKKALDDAIASGDPAALQALSADIDARTTELANAVQANQAPVPPPLATP